MKSLRPLINPVMFGTRLGYTYFSGLPDMDELNELEPSATDLDYEVKAVDSAKNYYFTIDDQLLYLSFYRDTGPLNVGCLYRFCLHLHTLLEDPTLIEKRIILYSSDEKDKKANAVLLITLYAMIVMRWSPADALVPIADLELQPHRDAGYSPPSYHLTLQPILLGIHKAISNNLLDLGRFDLGAYEKWEKVEEGDWNWIVMPAEEEETETGDILPKRGGFVAFASPLEAGWPGTETEPSHTTAGDEELGEEHKLSRPFRNVLSEFVKMDVRVVVRLNKKLYDRRHFQRRKIEHVEMYFDDGTNPTMEMTRQFIDLSDKVIMQGGSVAVHCKAGLGRTGTLIGSWLIYRFGFTAAEAIGFMRLMRPGSCVGPQQHFLYENQMVWSQWRALDVFRASQKLKTSINYESLLEEGIEYIPPVSEAKITVSAPATTMNILLRSPERSRVRPMTPNGSPQTNKIVTPRTVRQHSVQSTPVAQHPPRTPQRPRTPGITAPGTAVPGQPRKTPGKSKHGVATPETAPVDELKDEFEMAIDEGEEALVRKSLNKKADDLQLVKDENTEPKPVDVPPRPASTIERPKSRVTRSNIPPRPATAASTRSATKTVTSSRPTSRVSTRAATSRVTTNGPVKSAAKSSTKTAVKPVVEIKSSRYPTRKSDDSLSSAQGDVKKVTKTTTPLSPSRLPTRVLGKRRLEENGVVADLSKPQPSEPVQPLKRSVRRKKSGD